MRDLQLTGDGFSIEDVADVAHRRARVSLAAGLAERMAPARGVVTEAVRRKDVVYGVTTGFGALADTTIGADDLARLQVGILRSHAAATGDPLPPEVVRALLLLRARTLSAGYSGVRIDLPAMLLSLLEHDLLPVIPSKGSVGASGDLAQLAHLALPLIGEGRLRAPGDGPQGRPAAEVLAEYGLTPLELEPKEGLSLINGTEPMQAVLALAIVAAEELCRVADIACAVSVEALFGTDRAYDARVQVIRPHPGQLDSASNLRELLAGSPLLASHRFSDHAVQDSYALRCAPQVHGSARDLIAHCRRVLSVELSSIVDNPVVVRDETGDGFEVMSTGNFHGQPIAFAADALAMAVAELASIAERRVYRMLDPATSRGLPPFLAPDAGTNSGFMLAQYTAASLVSENKVLCHPASVDTIPTSGNQEDHVSMGWHAVRKAHEVIDNTRAVLAIELLCGAQGLDLRSDVAAPGEATGAVRDRIRSEVPSMMVDRELAPQIEAVKGMLPELVAVSGVARLSPDRRGRARSSGHARPRSAFGEESGHRRVDVEGLGLLPLGYECVAASEEARHQAARDLEQRVAVGRRQRQRDRVAAGCGPRPHPHVADTGRFDESGREQFAGERPAHLLGVDVARVEHDVDGVRVALVVTHAGSHVDGGEVWRDETHRGFYFHRRRTCSRHGVPPLAIRASPPGLAIVISEVYHLESGFTCRSTTVVTARFGDITADHPKRVLSGIRLFGSPGSRVGRAFFW
ncbi:histidine ammonia-lyase [Stackebrandtia albiflava]|uniref:Histidine ammonia-lyase n=1 Tax=Stackebrandtia albiflava TaxID=406432 RepID=A0A562VCN2_9ACTN|nr:histidine ammonia-lyase [Stackebrandtia albiflava]